MISCENGHGRQDQGIRNAQSNPCTGNPVAQPHRPGQVATITDVSNERLVMGIDGGGTRTRAALVSLERGWLGTGAAGSGNHHDVGFEEVSRHVGAARDAAFLAADLNPGPVDAAFLGMAGAATPSDHDRLCEIGRALSLAHIIAAGSDLQVALAGGLPDRPGVVLIAGTGSSCYGRHADGRTGRAGGFGSSFDDGGSATDIGRRALVACIRAADGRASPTVITEQLLDRLGVGTVRDIPARVDDGGFTRKEIAALAPLVTKAAGSGDAICQEILRAGANELALCVVTVAEKLDLPNPEVVLAGGLLTSDASYRSLVVQAIHRSLPDARPQEPAFSPVLGAALCAMKELGFDPGQITGRLPT